MVIRLESPTISQFDPSSAIENWMVAILLEFKLQQLQYRQRQKMIIHCNSGDTHLFYCFNFCSVEYIILLSFVFRVFTAITLNAKESREINQTEKKLQQYHYHCKLSCMVCLCLY